MAQYFEEEPDIEMTDFYDEHTPLIQDNPSYTTEETSFSDKSTRVNQLFQYLEHDGVENVPFDMNTDNFSMSGKRLMYKGKSLTEYDGSFKAINQIMKILHDDDVISHTPKRPRIRAQRSEIVKQLVYQLYDHMGYEKDNVEVNLDRFKVENENGFNVLYYEKNGKWYSLMKKTDGDFRTPEQINKVINKTNLRQLGLTVKELDKVVPTQREIEEIPLEDLGKIASDINDVLGEPSQLPIRELLGLDKALQRFSGEIVNGTSKLTEIKKHLEKENRKLEDSDITEQQKQRIRERINRLNEEYEVRLESLSQIKPKLQSQLARIRQTLNKIADQDRSLKERLQILWREQGLTLVSVLTAVGMTVATLVLALLPHSAQPTGGGKNPHKVKDWVKKSLNSLGRLFGKIAKWALSALPGAIGSIISWIFSLFKTVVTKLAEHTYAFIGFLVATFSYLVFRK